MQMENQTLRLLEVCTKNTLALNNGHKGPLKKNHGLLCMAHVTFILPA